MADLVAAFGGASALARTLGLKYASAIGEMKRVGRIDVDYWPAIIAAAPAAGIEGLDERHMARIQASRRGGAKRQEQPEAAQ